MAKHDASIDGYVETLKRVDDDSLASLSHTPAAQALYEEVTLMSEPDAKRDSSAATRSPATHKAKSRRRLIWRSALVVGAAVTVLAVLSIVNVFGANGPSIVEKAAAALNPTKNVILHVKISGTESLQGDTSSWTEESWSLMTSPYTRRDIQAFPEQAVLETVQDSTGKAQMYDAASNTIYKQAQASMFKVADGQAVPYGEMILDLLKSGDAIVDGKDTIDGREVIRIAATKDYGTATDGTKYGDWFYVDPDTNYPVAWRQTRDGGKVEDIHFDAYELLPANDQNLALLDLSAQHPGATVSATSLEDYRNSLNAPVPSGDSAAKK
jgi:hypothetical protein